jgi:hypothetical protein
MTSRRKFVLKPVDIASGWSQTSAGARSVNRASRASCVTSAECFLEHLPTKVRVSGDIPKGHYSRAEMTRLKAELFARLSAELEAEVAKLLRIPGR